MCSVVVEDGFTMVHGVVAVSAVVAGPERDLVDAGMICTLTKCQTLLHV